jgi:hypothetical protein
MYVLLVVCRYLTMSSNNTERDSFQFANVGRASAKSGSHTKDW